MKTALMGTDDNVDFDINCNNNSNDDNIINNNNNNNNNNGRAKKDIDCFFLQRKKENMIR